MYTHRKKIDILKYTYAYIYIYKFLSQMGTIVFLIFIKYQNYKVSYYKFIKSINF